MKNHSLCTSKIVDVSTEQRRRGKTELGYTGNWTNSHGYSEKFEFPPINFGKKKKKSQIRRNPNPIFANPPKSQNQTNREQRFTIN